MQLWDNVFCKRPKDKKRRVNFATVAEKLILPKQTIVKLGLDYLNGPNKPCPVCSINKRYQTIIILTELLLVFKCRRYVNINE